MSGEKAQRCDSSASQNSIHSEGSSEVGKINKIAVTALKDVLKEKIKINEDEAKSSRAIVTEFLDSLVSFLKNTDSQFKLIFQKLCYTGSSYEDLRISSANEFDINLVLNFPFIKEEFEVLSSPGRPFATYKLTSAFGKADLTEERKVLIIKFFQDEYLMPDKMKQWMQSIIDKTLRNPAYKKPGRVKNIIPSGSGPAKTVKLEISSTYTIDIDLVPVLRLPLDVLKKFNDHRLRECCISRNNRFVFLVPKPCEPLQVMTPMDLAAVNRTWRIHLPEAEKEILHDLGCVKPVVKLLKLLRDKEKWKILSSYYLKTVVQWEVRENVSPDFWKEDKMYQRLLEVLKKLASCVEQRNIPSFFFPKFNLIEKISEIHSVNICKRIQCIIKAMEKNPENLMIHF